MSFHIKGGKNKEAHTANYSLLLEVLKVCKIYV